MSNKKKKYRLVRESSTELIVKNRNSWTFTISVLGITGTICFMLITGKVNVDSSTLLSLILAFFSIYLSAQFYFKATEQSNQFYNTAFNHNKNISESLSGMKGEFGTSLRMIEESSNYMKGKFDELGKISVNIERLNEVQEEVGNLFESIFEKSEITADEKKQYEELFETQSQIVSQLERKLKEVDNIERFDIDKNWNVESHPTLSTLKILYKFHSTYLSQTNETNLSKNKMNKLFHEFIKSDNFTNYNYEQLKQDDIIDMSGNLTSNGSRLIRDLFHNYKKWKY